MLLPVPGQVALKEGEEHEEKQGLGTSNPRDGDTYLGLLRVQSSLCFNPGAKFA